MICLWLVMLLLHYGFSQLEKHYKLPSFIVTDCGIYKIIWILAPSYSCNESGLIFFFLSKSREGLTYEGGLIFLAVYTKDQKKKNMKQKKAFSLNMHANYTAKYYS